MKKLLLIAILIVSLISCNKDANETDMILGRWEVTEYVTDGNLIDEKTIFTSTSIYIRYLRGNGFASFIAERNENPCNHIYPITVSYDKNEMNFGAFSICDTLNKIDPYFYTTSDTTYAGKWEFEYQNKRILILSNKNLPREKTIKLILEKAS